MNIEKNQKYYGRLTQTDLCQCAYCKNYVREIRKSYPLVSKYLEDMGIDVEKPFETMPLEPNEKESIQYISVQYIAFGDRSDFKKAIVSGVNIDVSVLHPPTNIKEDHFVIDLFPIILKWNMAATASGFIGSVIPKSLPKRMQKQYIASKKLSEMTLEELWALFPIRLTEHKYEWKKQYNEMSVYLERRLSSHHVRISHIGSTAVKGIWAKPIVDMLVEIASDEDILAVAEIIMNSGFIKMSESENRMTFNCGYTEKGFAEKVYHLHLRCAGDNDELYFRDYMNDNPSIAEEYQQLKLELWHKYEYNRDAYTEAKTEFVREYTEKAKKLYGKRY